ncbi:hypothetical protein EON63_01880 [archaeon]|nr:MAG: hypothetical protein EON63_01880 [archaeon]
MVYVCDICVTHMINFIGTFELACMCIHNRTIPIHTFPTMQITIFIHMHVIFPGEHNEKAAIVSKTLRVLDETLGPVLKGIGV